MPIHKIQRELRANKPKLICSALHCAVWEIIVWKAFNCNTLLTFSALQKVKLNAMLFLYCLWCQYYACWTNKHNLIKTNFVYSAPFLVSACSSFLSIRLMRIQHPDLLFYYINNYTLITQHFNEQFATMMYQFVQNMPMCNM